LSRNLGTLTSWNPLGHSRPVTGLPYLDYNILLYLREELIIKLQILRVFVKYNLKISIVFSSEYRLMNGFKSEKLNKTLPTEKSLKLSTVVV
jgi:hypothetical protein